MVMTVVMIMMVVIVLIGLRSASLLEGFFEFAIHRGHELNGSMDVLSQ